MNDDERRSVQSAVVDVLIASDKPMGVEFLEGLLEVSDISAQRRI